MPLTQYKNGVIFDLRETLDSCHFKVTIIGQCELFVCNCESKLDAFIAMGERAKQYKNDYLVKHTKG